MEQKIAHGLSKTLEMIVEYEHTAARYGSGLVEVYATPAMVAFMEKTALETVLAFLPEGHGTVGTAVNIKHTKATPVGMTVKCTATVKETDGRRILFDVHATDDEGEIGHGQHERFVINNEKFMAKLMTNRK
ncbi:MAG: thioesterase family protein [Bacteroidetes bacterium]|nr:thioesterase family protein [Bacteroidota bacterium]MBU1720658.1 thioesterase family protein [Bacteroidota bacterium]